MAHRAVNFFYFVVIVFFFVSFQCSGQNVDNVDDLAFSAGNSHIHFGQAKPMRYLLYDINPGEGFNLRRDVYMRVANLVKFLNQDEPWTLVLPPWGRLYHWKSKYAEENIKIPWKSFFDLISLGRHVPVIEFEDYVKVIGKPEIEEIYYLQRYAEGWTDGKWEEKMDERECIDKTGFVHDSVLGHWKSWFWGYEDTYGLKFKCMSTQAQASFLKPFLMKNTTARSVLLLRVEHILHDRFGDKDYWTARRSMVFAKQLRDVGDEFREKFLKSTDEKDNTVLDENWTNMERNHGEAKGGPYLAIHWRRRDFLYGHRKDVPSITGTAQQVEAALKKNKLDTVFVATDAPPSEYNELKSLLKDFHVYRYEPTDDELRTYKDGGIAIIDQWICAHARYFMGTSVSTFTFRIHEEREILGFDPSMTFNRFCGDDIDDCEQPTKWVIKYR